MGRVTIAGGLVLIAGVAVSLAALRDASLVWGAMVPLFSASILAFAVAMAFLRRGRRAPWVAFSAVGFAYFLYCVPFLFGSGPIPSIPLISYRVNRASQLLEPPPPTIRPLWLPKVEWMKLPLEERKARALAMNQDSEKDRQHEVAMQVRARSFAAIAHSVLALVFGLIGSLMVGLPAWWYRKMKDRGRTLDPPLRADKEQASHAAEHPLHR